MNSLINEIRETSRSLFPLILDARRHLHKNPELSFEEHQTAAFISEFLAKHGVDHQRIGGTGLTGVIKGKNSNKTIALRADIDALPITENNEVEYKSSIPGRMHACGHDVHTSCLLGAVLILKKYQDQLPCNVKFIFQPGEEKLPGGASLLIKEGVLENPDVSGIFGQHVFPELEAGKVGFRKGMYMASTDEIYITVKGVGGHGAMPHKVKDPVLTAAHIITGLQQVVSRNANPFMPTVLSFGKVVADGATNVIPDEVKLEGTFRTFNEEWRKEAHELIKRQAAHIADSLGTRAEVNIQVGYPFLKNDEGLTENAAQLAKDFLGEENVVELEMRATAEDFAFYSQKVPACFYRLGVRNEAKGIVHGVHNSRFDIEEEALITGTGLMAWLAMNSY